MKRRLALALLLLISPADAQTPADSTYGFGPPPSVPQSAPQPAPAPSQPQPGDSLRGSAATGEAPAPCQNAATARQLQKLEAELAQVARLLNTAHAELANLQTDAALRSSAVSRSAATRAQIAPLQSRIAAATAAQTRVRQQAAYIRSLRRC